MAYIFVSMGVVSLVPEDSGPLRSDGSDDCGSGPLVSLLAIIKMLFGL